MKTLNDKLTLIQYRCSLLYAKDRSGEPFHDGYKLDKHIFNKLIRTNTKLESSLKRYFKDLSERAIGYINWTKYNSKILEASVVTDMIDADWEGEQLILRVLLTDSLIDAILAGGQLTELETGIGIGFNATSKTALDFVKSQSLKLAKGLTDTTKDKLQSALVLSISNGEDQETASSRLADILDDENRASTIANTETVNAFTAGRLEVADEVGADRKEWSAAGDPCIICAKQ